MAYLCLPIIKLNMKIFNRNHHNKIHKALSYFDSSFFQRHHIIFGGGTRIAMEIDEYRESVDIDIICPTISAYKAARSEISSNSLGKLVKKEFNYLREIRADRYAARTFIEIDKIPIKVEIISFADYRLNSLLNPLINPNPKQLDTPHI